MTSHAERVGFVGLGFMGHGMAHNILTKGYPLAVMAHRKREAVEDLVGKGATEVSSPTELAKVSDVIVLCLTASPQVEGVVQALLPTLQPGAVIVDCSTSDPVSTLKLGALLNDRKVGFVDAPLGRTPNSLQKFVSVHSSITNHFNSDRSHSSRPVYKAARTAALTEWRQLGVS